MTSTKACKSEANGYLPRTYSPTCVLPDNYPTMIQKYTSCRWRLGYMLILAFILVQSIQNSMSFAVVCMTGATTPAKAHNVSLYFISNSSNNISGDQVSQGEFDFSSETQGLLISSVFYAAVVSPMLGTLISSKFGPKRVITFSMLMGGLVMMVLPTAARANVYLAVGCRIVIGLCVNTVAPVSMDFWLYWAPVEEKVQLVAYSFTGYNMANVIVFALSGFLCLIPIDNGWPFIFYVFGGLTVVWCMIWQLKAHETPDSHPTITDDERTYIHCKRSKISSERKKTKIPWKRIAVSKGVWAYLILQFCHNWNSTVLFSYLPSYMATVLKFDIEQNGLLSSLPYITRVLGTFLLGYISVKLARVLSITNTRKLIQSGGFFGAAALAIALCYLEEGQEYTAVAIFVLSTPFHAATVTSSIVTPLDMAPQFASMISSVGMAVSMASSMLSPMVVSFIVTERSREQWTYVFYTNAGVFIFGAVVFLLFGTGELQTWADNSKQIDVPTTSEKKSEMNIAYISDVAEITHM